MPISLDRVRTFSPGDTVPAAALNAIQDRVSDNDQDLQAQLNDQIAELTERINRNSHGDKTRRIAPIPDHDATNCSYTTFGGYLQATAGGAHCYLRLDMDEGDRIKAIAVEGYGTGQSGSSIGLRLYRAQSGIAVVRLQGTPASWTNQSQTLDPSHTVTGAHYVLGIELSHSGQRVRDLRIIYDRP